MRRPEEVWKLPLREWTTEEILREHTRGLDLGSDWRRHRIIARNNHVVLIHVPGHMAWTGNYMPRVWHPAWVRLWKPGTGLMDGEVFVVNRQNRLTPAAIEKLKELHL